MLLGQLPIFLAHTQEMKDCLSLSSAIAFDAWVCYKTSVYFWFLMWTLKKIRRNKTSFFS